MSVTLREIGRPERFALVEEWRDKTALDAHAKALAALQQRLRPQLAAPFDRRSCVGLDNWSGGSAVAATW